MAVHRRPGGSDVAERRAQRLIAVSFFVLAVYVAVESLRDARRRHHPEASWVGIALAAVTAPTMPLLARAKRRVGEQLGSSATVSGAPRTSSAPTSRSRCWSASALNALLGWWWADPLAALVIAGVAVKEGAESWRGEGCTAAESRGSLRGSPLSLRVGQS